MSAQTDDAVHAKQLEQLQATATEQLDSREFPGELETRKKIIEVVSSFSEINRRDFLISIVDAVTAAECAGDFDGAQSILNRAIDSHGDDKRFLIADEVASFNQSIKAYEDVTNLVEPQQEEFREAAVLLRLSRADLDMQAINSGLDVYERLLGVDHYLVASQKVSTAEQLRQKRRFPEAIPFYLFACKHFKNNLGELNARTLLAQLDLGRCYFELDDVVNADFWLKQAADGMNEKEDVLLFRFAIVNITYGSLLGRMGRYNDSRIYFERSYDAHLKAGETSRFLSHTLGYLAQFAGMIGDSQSAREYARASLAELEKLNPGSGSRIASQIAQAKVTLSECEMNVNQPVDALRLLDEAKTLMIDAKEEQSREYSFLLKSRASTLLALGQHQEAEQEIANAIAIYEAVPKAAANSPELARFLVTQGEIQASVFRYEEAIDTLTRAVDLEKSLPRPDLRQIGVTSRLLGDFSLANGNRDMAETAYLDAMTSFNELFHQSDFLDEKELAQFSQLQKLVLGRLVLLVDVKNNVDVKKLYHWVLQTKGLALRATRRRSRRVNEIAETIGRDSVQKLLDKRRRFSKALLLNLSQQVNDRKSVDYLALERRLAFMELVSKAEPGPAEEPTTPDSLLSQLPSDTSIIDILRISSVSGEEEYVAFVISRAGAGESSISMTSLGDADSIDQHINENDRSLALENARGPDLEPVRASRPLNSADHLYSAVWNKLEPLIGDITTVVVCPDGEFAKLSWDLLRQKADAAPLIERFSFVACSDVASLPAMLAEDPQVPERLLLVGDVDYGQSGPARKQTILARDEKLRDLPVEWSQLDQSGPEIDRISDLSPGSIDVTILTKKDATESALFERLAGCDGLHVAQHGFSYQISEAASIANSGIENSMTSLQERYPMATIGLVMSSANELFADSNLDEDDQLLTGDEFMFRDLSHVRLAVLSACQTAKGQSNQGEGVFGLQQSLHWAGVRTTIASKWNVGDAETSRLMPLFYENMYRDNMSKGDALRHAKLTLHRKGDVSPAHWASWTLGGDWR